MNTLKLRTTMILSFVLATTALSASELTITVSAPNRGYVEVPVTALVDAPPGGKAALKMKDGPAVPVQIKMMGAKAEISWIVKFLDKGQSKTYILDTGKADPANYGPSSLVDLEKKDGNLDIKVRNEMFATYNTTTGPNKPYFYPLYGPDNKLVVRHFPIEKVEGETNDHPHHRGLWFTHGAVNGVDYWSEGAKTGKTVQAKYEDVTSGPVYGSFRAFTDWIDPSGKKVAEDVRDVRVWNVADGRLMDFSVTVKSAGDALLFGDTKEGSFGLRLPDSMRVAGGDGHIVTSQGDKDAAAWGKRAEWVDYYGTVDRDTVGVAILDNPKNLRFPTFWHVRDYGLFAANPFGIHEFTNDKEHPKVGDYTVPAGGSVTFKYRVFIHNGNTEEAKIADVWGAYSDPPSVEIK